MEEWKQSSYFGSNSAGQMSQTNMAGLISGLDVTVCEVKLNEEADGTINTSASSDTHQDTTQRPCPKAALALMDVKEIIGASYGEVGVFQCVRTASASSHHHTHFLCT